MKYSQLDRDMPHKGKKEKTGRTRFRSIRNLFLNGTWAEKGLFLLALIVFLISAFFLVRYAIASLHSVQVNEGLRDLHETAETKEDRPEKPEAVPTGAEETVKPEKTVQPAAQETGSPALPLSAWKPEPTFSPYYFDMSGSVLPEMNGLYAFNSDLAGWLKIDSTVDLPVVYRDNEYYLTHDFYRQAAQGGTLFVDEFGPVSSATQNLLIHGHNMKDGSMFGPLNHYYRNDAAWVRRHAFVEFSTLYQKNTYVLFAVAKVSTQPGNSQYLQFMGRNTFSSEQRFHSYIDQLRGLSIYDIPIDVEPCDSLLTLSTCLGDDRLLVCFRKVRQNESREQLSYQITQAAAR